MSRVMPMICILQMQHDLLARWAAARYDEPFTFPVLPYEKC